ncbi:hypothetical protein MMG00_10810 [Ignatzschineria rhizosphaerae]|uniref:Uncharacterized protein n=1 Tax=Ignatzschineria rhizosphaerae TaxID=2923279 RepID=A0ABY3WYK3_9GAMM|nr:hypothetical protein [Ignatzschineria rhizosphaerae]UNM95699.1 hypothetical protein MMG00_10810 [Ignatzschineria rhizosphaerae]
MVNIEVKAKVPQKIPRGVFYKGADFQELRSGIIKMHRKRWEKAARKAITEDVNETRKKIVKIIVTDEDICFYDKQDQIVFKI